MRTNPERLTPEYKQWRTAVLRRDKFACKKCGRKRSLNAHHIYKWADYPSMRFVIGNGITLCRFCHRNINTKEDEYIGLCKALISGQGFVMEQAKLLRDKYDEQKN